MKALALALALAAAPSQNDVQAVMETVAHGSRPEVERAIDRIQYLGTPKAIVADLSRMAQGDLPGSPENAVYVLSVLHPPEAGPVFARLLGDDSAPLRMAACQGLGHLKPSKGPVAAAVAARLSDPVAAVRRDCARTLTAWDGAGQGPALAKALGGEKDPDARLAELEALGHAPGKARPDWMGTSLRTREIIRKQRFHWPAEKVSARSKRWGIHREDP